tara:strand:+ start:379 stop:729 length:351 start_codon:yes stop_codon:yes gene_type:complete
MTVKQCSQCQEGFYCGAGDKPGSCWCVAFPPIMPLVFEQDCFCPTCLSEVINDRIILLVNEKGMSHIQTLAEPYREQSGLIEHVDYELKENLYIYSAWYLIKQGKCCNNSCQNCPY